MVCLKKIINFIGLSSLAIAGVVKQKRGKLGLIGVNESGAEFGNNVPGTYGKDYTWYDLKAVNQLIDNGFNIIRVNFLMERITPGGLTAAIEPNYLNNLTQTVNVITSKGAYAIINPHNYGRFYGNVITDTKGFMTWWQNLAKVFAGNPRVVFDTNNEYHDMATNLVFQLNQAAINGIRAAGATSQSIHVEGNAYTGAASWTTATGTDGVKNSDVMQNLKDPQNKIVYQMHQYLDSDGSGTSANCVSTTIGSQRVKDATTWLRNNGKVGFIGETAGGVNPTCEAAIKDLLNFLSANTDVWKGAAWWSAGPWWPQGYYADLEPNKGAAYSTYSPILTSYK